MRIIGAIGANGSGKDEVLKYLKQRYGVPFLSTGEIVREIAARDGVEPTRENLGAISEQCFAERGPGCFVAMAAERIHVERWLVAGISGIRSADDVRLLKRTHGDRFVLIHVMVRDPHVRFERMMQRAEARDPKDLEHFQALDTQEEKQFRISEAASYADHTVANDGTLEDLHRSIDHLVSNAGLLSSESDPSPELIGDPT